MVNLLSSSSAFFAALISLFIGALGSLVFRRHDKLANNWGHSFSALGSLFGLMSSLSVIILADKVSYKFASSLSFLAFSINIDKLSAFFVFTISLISLFSSIYGFGYGRHFFGKYNLGALGFFYNLFIAGMLLVVAASDAVFFLIVWEIMSLASFFLVIYEHREQENIQAGFLYFVMTHVGTAFIALVFLLLYGVTGSFDFVDISGSAALSPVMKNLIFILALLGFGTKAGIIPLHIWLPGAHPAAPSHVSALMSGVMIKTGIYMFIRLFLDLLPAAPVWWGATILILGAVSALLGVLYALTEHDLKRLLAYHSIENIGIILLGLGGAMIFYSYGLVSLALLGLVAALFHVLNHAVFKALLFMGAGGVITATHTRNMEEYGGLVKRLPWTALFFLFGAMAISALPPLNGFWSEWLTFQSLFSGIISFAASIRWVFILAAGSLAFVGGLAAMCFVKAFASTFLGRPRSEEARYASEPVLTMRLGMASLAASTVLLGLFSGSIVNIISLVVVDIRTFSLATQPFLAGGSWVAIGRQFSGASAAIIFLVLVLGLLAAWVLVRFMGRIQPVKIGRTWDCGEDLTPRMEITATGFSRSIITIFKGILRPSQQAEVEYKDADMRYFPKSQSIEFQTKDIYRAFLYEPVGKLITLLSELVKRFQSGNLNVYILYIFIALAALLLLATA